MTNRKSLAPKIRVVPPAPPAAHPPSKPAPHSKPMGSAKKRRAPGSLGPEAIAWRPFAADLLDKLVAKDKDEIFTQPVTDDIAPGYSDIIDRPMDLTTLRKKLKKGRHAGAEAFKNDVRLIWDNCTTYNDPSTGFHKLAVSMRNYSSTLFYQMDAATEDAIADIRAAEPAPPSPKRPAPEHAPATPARPAAPPTAPRSPQDDSEPVGTSNTRAAPQSPTSDRPTKPENKEPGPSTPPDSQPDDDQDQGTRPPADEILDRIRAYKKANRDELRQLRQNDPERDELVGAAKFAATVDTMKAREKWTRYAARTPMKPVAGLTDESATGTWERLGPDRLRGVPLRAAQTDPRLAAATALDKFVTASAPTARVILESMITRQPVPESIRTRGVVEPNDTPIDEIAASVLQGEGDCEFDEQELQKILRRRGLVSQASPASVDSLGQDARKEWVSENARLLQHMRRASLSVVQQDEELRGLQDEELRLAQALRDRLANSIVSLRPDTFVSAEDAKKTALKLLQSSAASRAQAAG